MKMQSQNATTQQNKDTTRLSEAEIRPDALYQETLRVHELDRQWLMERRSNFVEVDCPACGAKERAFVYSKEAFDYQRCQRCVTMYISPRPSQELLFGFYAQSKNYAHWANNVFPASAEIRRQKIFKPRVQKILEICENLGVGRGALMEVGSAFGLFVDEVNKTGAFARVIGVEPTPELAARCRSLGVETIELPIEKVEMQDKRPDVIASFEVIEHLFEPRGFLSACARNLADNGLLVLTCPAVSGFDVTVLGTQSDTVDFEHLNYFSPSSLSALLTSVGLEVVDVKTPGKLDADMVRRRALSGAFSLAGQPFLQQVLIDEWDRAGDAFQSFLADNMLSSHMWIVARKKAQ